MEPLSPFQTGIAVAQKRSRDKFQSGACSIFFAKRPCLRCAGNQLISSFFSSINSLLPSTSKNQLGNARYIIRCLLRGLNGYSCLIYSIFQMIPFSSRHFAINLLPAQTSMPFSSVSRTPISCSFSAHSGK